MTVRVSSPARHWLTALGAIGAVLACAAVAIGVAVATDQSAFCTSCHEMQPFHQAWAKSPHANVPCVDCHVERGIVAHLEHKIVALAEVRAHFLNAPTFPLKEAPDVPDDRCVACHTSVVATRPGFSHAEHAERGRCQSCHSDAAHDVAARALDQAGILNRPALEARASARTANVGKGAANLAGHVQTACQACHDMKATGCKSCHTPKHVARKQDCGTCHSPGPKFVFSHPASPACVECHTRPANHDDAACGRCHPEAGITWAFDHDSAAGPDCEGCHTRPEQHTPGACSTCHASGASWAFSHPASESCADCHKAPTGHPTAACSACHRAGSTWAFSHPGASSNCTTCHAQPSGHPGGTCTTCHRTGPDWAFYHPSTGGCSSCHRAPANHYGSSCASCHSAATPWASARFQHPAIPGGKHTYRSFACSNCHTNGYSSATCTKCHDSSAGPKDDD